MDDPSLLGVDHGEKVGRLDPGALVQAGEIEEFLRGRLHRLAGAAVEGPRPVGRTHSCSFRPRSRSFFAE
jgi:hypothetical protein